MSSGPINPKDTHPKDAGKKESIAERFLREAQKNKNLGPQQNKPTIQAGVSSDKFKAASSTLAGVFGAPNARKPNDKGPVKPAQPSQPQGGSPSMKERQAALEMAKKLDETKRQAEVAPSAPSQVQPVASAAPVAPSAPDAPPIDVPVDVPEAPSAPEAPEAPAAPTASDMAELIKARLNAKPNHPVSGSANKAEDKGNKTQPVGGGMNFAAEAAKRRAEMEKRKAEGGSNVAPRTQAAPTLTEAQIKAQERAKRFANKDVTKTESKPPITTQADKDKEKAKLSGQGPAPQNPPSPYPRNKR